MLHRYHPKYQTEKKTFVAYVVWKIYCLKKQLFPNILSVEVTKVLKRGTFNQNTKIVVMITTERTNLTAESSNYFLR